MFVRALIVVAVWLAPLGAQELAVVEPETEVSFSAQLAPPGAAPTTPRQRLLGVGVREKWVFDVYAIGVYVEPGAVHALMGQALEAAALPDAAESPAQVAARRLGELNAPAMPRTLQLVMVRDVDAEDMREAFEDVLQPRLTQRTTGERRAAALAALKAFRAVFAKPASEGQVLRFAWHPASADEPAGRLVVTVDGAVRHSATNADLAWALFDVYLGGDPISADAKASCLRGLPALSARGRPPEPASGAADARR